ncbi:LOW QUALITY PROTEIN: polyprotein [Phytophthora megakarya]|uniref:Polyprotein n=1 Tax=Phytophthora megakarya TaxID=4795 RepID=A0A225W1T7_9STRA|nr:LOW QUALITY PROTEIN: polyprotein [Phytophthora megakarya]
MTQEKLNVLKVKDEKLSSTILRIQYRASMRTLYSTPPIREGIEHEILLKPGTKPVSVKQWRQSPDQYQIIQDWTKEMVQAGIIRPSTSAFSAPTFCVKKPVGWRIVHDFRQLNLATILQVFPMPRKEDTFVAMAGNFWYSQAKGGRYTLYSFSTPDGLFEYLVTPWDSVVVQEHVSEHLEALDRVLKRCEEQKLYLKLSKCQFCMNEIPCLGDFVERNGVHMDPGKVKIIADGPVPKTKKQLESFLGTTVYVSRFCKDFAQSAGPLHDGIRGKRSHERIQPTEDQLRCFEGLMRRLSSPPVFKLLDFLKPFGIRMVTSNFASGEACSKPREGWNIQLLLLVTKPTELNYPVREQELLVMMHDLKTWRVYLLDKPFTVETDHKSIEMNLTQKTTNRMIARWFNEPAEFQPLFKWIREKQTRKPDFEHKTAQVSLKELFQSAQNREFVATVVAFKMTVALSAKQMYSWKKELLWIIKRLKEGDKIHHYSINDDVLHYQTQEDEAPRLYIPADEDLKKSTFSAMSTRVRCVSATKLGKPKPPGLLPSLDVPKDR